MALIPLAMYSPAGSVPPPCHLTSYTPTKSNFYFDSTFGAVTSEPAPYKLPSHTSHVPYQPNL
jgi:hypothetical protein